jgi:hypothetical protein
MIDSLKGPGVFSGPARENAEYFSHAIGGESFSDVFLNINTAEFAGGMDLS